MALGKESTAGGHGLLLGNPHFPWDGPERFYQAQLTLPGKVNVSGASLFGVPLILIGGSPMRYGDSRIAASCISLVVTATSWRRWPTVSKPCSRGPTERAPSSRLRQRCVRVPRCSNWRTPRHLL